MTKLDPKCTSDGRHVNADLCLEDPFGNEAEVSRIGVVALLLRLPLLLEHLLQCDICNHPLTEAEINTVLLDETADQR